VQARGKDVMRIETKVRKREANIRVDDGTLAAIVWETVNKLLPTYRRWRGRTAPAGRH
jgi:hypothetical protein